MDAKLELQLTMILVLIKKVEAQIVHQPQDKSQTPCTVVTDAMDQDILEETLTHHLVWLRRNLFQLALLTQHTVRMVVKKIPQLQIWSSFSQSLIMLSILSLTANLHLGKLPTQCMEEMVALQLLLRKDQSLRML